MFPFGFDKATCPETAELEVVRTPVEGWARAYRAWEQIADMTFDDDEIIRLLTVLPPLYPANCPDPILMGHFLSMLLETRATPTGRLQKWAIRLLGSGLFRSSETRTRYLRGGRTIACLLAQGCQVIPLIVRAQEYWTREDDASRQVLLDWNHSYSNKPIPDKIQLQRRAKAFYGVAAKVCEQVADGSLLKKFSSAKKSSSNGRPEQLLFLEEAPEVPKSLPQNIPAPEGEPEPVSPPLPSQPEKEDSNTDDREVLSRIFDSLSSGATPEPPAYTPENYGHPPGKLRYLKGMRVWVKKNATLHGPNLQVASDNCFVTVACDQQEGSGEIRCMFEGREVGISRDHLLMNLIDLFSAAGKQAGALLG